MDRFTEGYIECALWASEMDDKSVDDLAPATLKDMTEACADFQETNRRLLEAANAMGRDDDYLGHDFWLTRNRHGTGFWDRGLGEIGDELTRMSRPYGSQDLYVGDDGLVYAA